MITTALLYSAVTALAGGLAASGVNDSTSTSKVDSAPPVLASSQWRLDKAAGDTAKRHRPLFTLSRRDATNDTTGRLAPLSRRTAAGTIIGGYVDLEYHNYIDRHQSVFDQHRLVPFISAQISPKIHFSTELEFEHSTKIEIEGGEPEGFGEVRVEFAHLDFAVSQHLTIRGGIILEPLGAFNTAHDAPLNEFTTRPLSSELIIASVLSEPGVGVTGSVQTGKRSYVTYEAYIVNGFTTGILTPDGVRTHEGLAVGEEDNNFAKSLVGRLGFTPITGLDLGVSAHTGKYTAGGGAFTGDERLTISAFDAAYRVGALTFLGEYDQLTVDLPTTGPYSTLADRQNGFYAQGSYNFGFRNPGSAEESYFTGVARWEHVDLASGRDGDERDRLSVGFNWRPVTQSVFKFSMDWDWTTPPGLTKHGSADRAFRASMASYF